MTSCSETRNSSNDWPATHRVAEPVEEVGHRVGGDLLSPPPTRVVEALVPRVDEVDDAGDLLGGDAVLLFFR